MKKNPPIRFVKSQILNGIVNHNVDLMELEKAGKISIGISCTKFSS